MNQIERLLRIAEALRPNTNGCEFSLRRVWAESGVVSSASSPGGGPFGARRVWRAEVDDGSLCNGVPAYRADAETADGAVAALELILRAKVREAIRRTEDDAAASIAKVGEDARRRVDALRAAAGHDEGGDAGPDGDGTVRDSAAVLFDATGGA